MFARNRRKYYPTPRRRRFCDDPSAMHELRRDCSAPRAPQMTLGQSGLASTSCAASASRYQLGRRVYRRSTRALSSRHKPRSGARSAADPDILNLLPEPYGIETKPADRGMSRSLPGAQRRSGRKIAYALGCRCQRRAKENTISADGRRSWDTRPNLSITNGMKTDNTLGLQTSMLWSLKLQEQLLCL